MRTKMLDIYLLNDNLKRSSDIIVYIVLIEKAEYHKIFNFICKLNMLIITLLKGS